MQPRLLLLVGILLACGSGLAAAHAWDPVPPEDVAAVPPADEPDVNGLTLLREILVDSSDGDGTRFAYHTRVKVFTAAGVESLNKTEIPFDRDSPPRRLAARVLKPDGRSIEVARDAFYTRDVVKTGGEALAVKAFTFPALEPGDIAEYRYDINQDQIVAGMRFYFDDAFPAALVRVRLGVARLSGLGLQSLWSGSSRFADCGTDRNGKLLFEARNVPATVAEPFSPPDDMVKPWFLFYYTIANGTAKEFWSYTGGELQELAEDYLASKRPIKDTVAKLLTGNPAEDEAIRRLYEFCRTQIKNLSHDGSGYTPDQIEKLKPNRSGVDILKNGYGTAEQINLLFGALMKASGRYCYLVYCGDRSHNFFDPELKTRTALPHLVVATEMTGTWKFYDPGARYLPAGKLDWKNEKTTAIAVADKRWQFVETPSSEVGYSTTRRTADFTLDADGALEGDISIALNGHTGFAAKHRFGAKTASECAEIIKADLVDRLGQVEVSAAKVDLPDDLDAPITLSCHIRIADYASPLGDRLILPLAFFQKGVAEVFTATTRKLSIYFPYFQTEDDKVTFALPEGYKLEPPGRLRNVDSQDLIHFSPRLDYDIGMNRLRFERTFIRRLYHLAPSSYAALQDNYRRIAESDARTFSLVRTDASPSGGQ